MTICNALAEYDNGRDNVTAYKCYDKYCNIPYYEIVVSRDGIAICVEKTARTTWRKKFKELTR